jgi:hypothetical protein
MKLTPDRSRKILRQYGCWLTSACDKCGKALGSTRYTIKGQKGEWCSFLCRDGAERKALGLCQSCRGSLNGKRKGTRFCSDTCRKRDAKQNGLTHPNYRGMAAHSKELKTPVRGLPYCRSSEAMI